MACVQRTLAPIIPRCETLGVIVKNVRYSAIASRNERAAVSRGPIIAEQRSRARFSEIFKGLRSRMALPAGKLRGRCNQAMKPGDTRSIHRCFRYKLAANWRFEFSPVVLVRSRRRSPRVSNRVRLIIRVNNYLRLRACVRT